MTLAEKQQQMIDDLALIENPQERFAAVVDRAKTRPPLPEADRTEANRVKGCVSLAWITEEVRDGRCHFRCDADSPLVRGLLVLLCDLYSGATPAEVAARGRFQPAPTSEERPYVSGKSRYFTGQAHRTSATFN